MVKLKSFDIGLASHILLYYISFIILWRYFLEYFQLDFVDPIHELQLYYQIKLNWFENVDNIFGIRDTFHHSLALSDDQCIRKDAKERYFGEDNLVAYA